MVSTGHGDRDRMIKVTRHKYANIALLFWSCLSRCQECQKKSKRRMTEFAKLMPRNKQQADHGISEPSHEVLCSATSQNQTSYRSCSTFRAPSERHPTSSRKLKTFWPALELGQKVGKHRHLHILGFVNRANGDVKYC